MITPVRKSAKSHHSKQIADRTKKPHDNLEARLQSLKLKRHFSKSRVSLLHMHDTPRYTSSSSSPVPTVTRGFSSSSFLSDNQCAKLNLNSETSFEVSPSVHCVSMVMESLSPRSAAMKTLVRFAWTCVVAVMVTGWWRGVWLLMDSYPVVDDGENWQNAVFSLLLGLGLVAVCFASRQALVRRFLESQEKALDDLATSTPTTRRLSLIGKALDWIFSIVLAFAVVAQMRGAWYLCDLYILPNDVEASAWITLSAAFVVLTLSSSFKCVVTDVFAEGISTIGPFFSSTAANRTAVAGTPYRGSTEFDTSDFYDYNQKTGTYTRERVTPVKKMLDDSFSSAESSQCHYSDDSGGASESDPEMRAHLEARACARDGKLQRPVPTSGRDKRLSFAEFMGIDERSIDSRGGGGGKEKVIAKKNTTAAAAKKKKSAFSLFSPHKKPQSKVRSMGLASSECTPARASTVLRNTKVVEMTPDKLSEIELATPQKDNDMEGFHAGDTPGSAGVMKYHARITARST